MNQEFKLKAVRIRDKYVRLAGNELRGLDGLERISRADKTSEKYLKKFNSDMSVLVSEYYSSDEINKEIEDFITDCVGAVVKACLIGN